MRRGHDGYTNRTNRASCPRMSLTERELEFVRWWAALEDSDHGPTAISVGRRMGISKPTAYQYRNAAIALGALTSTGYGLTRKVRVSEAGRALCAGDSAKCKHPKQPKDYVLWHAWAEEKIKTHEQMECPYCGKFELWEKRKSPEGAA